MVRMRRSTWQRLLEASGQELGSVQTSGTVRMTWESARDLILQAAARADSSAVEPLAMLLCLTEEQARRRRVSA